MALRGYLKNRAVWLLGLIALFTIFGPFLGFSGEMDLPMKNRPPSPAFWFGTDELGRDVFTKTALGGRISLSIALFATVIKSCLGIFFASLAVYKGKKLDLWLLRIFDVLQSVPYLLIAMFLTFLFSPGFQTILFAMTLTGWIPMARIVRSELLYVQKEDYVLAAKAIGASRSRILFCHLLPNAKGPIIASILLTVPTSLFTEAFLSFLGLGIQAPSASWGVLLNDAVGSISYYPWRFFFPAFFLSGTLFAFHLLSRGAPSKKEAFNR